MVSSHPYLGALHKGPAMSLAAVWFELTTFWFVLELWNSCQGTLMAKEDVGQEKGWRWTLIQQKNRIRSDWFWDCD